MRNKSNQRINNNISPVMRVARSLLAFAVFSGAQIGGYSQDCPVCTTDDKTVGPGVECRLNGPVNFCNSANLTSGLECFEDEQTVVDGVYWTEFSPGEWVNTGIQCSKTYNPCWNDDTGCHGNGT